MTYPATPALATAVAASQIPTTIKAIAPKSRRLMVGLFLWSVPPGPRDRKLAGPARLGYES